MASTASGIVVAFTARSPLSLAAPYSDDRGRYRPPVPDWYEHGLDDLFLPPLDLGQLGCRLGGGRPGSGWLGLLLLPMVASCIGKLLS